MSVSALIYSNGAALGVTGGTLIAMAGSDIRGVLSSTQGIPFGPYVGNQMFGITVYADDNGETISFQYQTSTKSYTIAETVPFVIDGNVGNAIAPQILTATEAAAAVSSPPPSP